MFQSLLYVLKIPTHEMLGQAAPAASMALPPPMQEDCAAVSADVSFRSNIMAQPFFSFLLHEMRAL